MAEEVQMEHPAKHAQQRRAMKGSYIALGLELAVDFVIMYLVMYTMIATLDHFHLNINNVYMTLMMVAPMAVVMLVAMRSMFPSRRANLVLVAAAALVFAASLFAMRSQAAVGDEEFLRAMIPHHSGAILMCEQASLTDREIIALCGDIVRSQREEIAQMQAILARD
jgi:FtsH-binding integral membrane protein